MTKALPILMSAAFLVSACAAKESYDPAAMADTESHLDDCTEVIAPEMGWDIPVIADSDRRNLVLAASAWAEDNCYAPCTFRMCATISAYDGNSASIYISYDIAQSNAAGEIVIGPEAFVDFDLPTYRVRKSGFYHTGCRFNASDCRLEFNR